MAAQKTSKYADQITRLRQRHGLTQAQLAELLGVTPAAVSQWENGRVTPSQDYQARISRADMLGLHTIGAEYVPQSLVRDAPTHYQATAAPTSMDFTADSDIVRLVLHSQRLAYGHQSNPTFATETSKIDPLPHQHTAVYERMLPQARLRFLLADDAGAGKTIMAGLYIRQMLTRRLLRRVLIVPPAGLVGNWASEMHKLFSLPFRPIDGSDARAGNPFRGAASDLLIVSVDTLAGETTFGRLQESGVTPYDLVIFDEAHKLAARQGKNLSLEKTDRYRLAEALAGIRAESQRWQLDWHAHHLLLLTATPHMGKDFPYYCLWRLLEPEALATFEAFQAYPQAARRAHFIRRTKEEMVDLAGEPIYPPRISNTLSYALTQGPVSEQQLYDETTAYLTTTYNQAQMLNSSAAKLAMGVFQRRLASSTYALMQSLEHRLDKLADWIADIHDGTLSEEDLEERQRNLGKSGDVFETTTADEEEGVAGRESHEVKEEEALGGTVARNLVQLEAECQEVARLLALARRLYHDPAHEDAKFARLRDVMRDPQYADEKMLIFTEHRDTLIFLVERLQQLGYTGEIAQIHGGMPYPAREKQVASFRQPVAEGGARYLVATDAAGEGINLQFCWLMVNYDIPWNPARLEQRMGRIHRYGQARDRVIIINLVAGQTREGQVLKVLLDKLETIRKALHKDKVFDMIGKLFAGKSITEYMAQVLQTGDATHVVAEVAARVTSANAASAFQEDSQTYGAPDDPRADLARLQVEHQRNRFQRLLPANVRRFLDAALPLLGIEMRGSWEDYFSLLPQRQGALDPIWPALEQYSPPARKKLTILRELAAPEVAGIFLRPGEPVFDALMQRFYLEHGPQALQGSTFIDPTVGAAYLFHLIRVDIARGALTDCADFAQEELLESRLMGLQQDEAGRVTAVPVEHLLLLRAGTGAYGPYLDLVARAEKLREQAETYALKEIAQPLAEQHRAEVQKTLDERLTFIRQGYDYKIAELATQRNRYRDLMRQGDTRAKAEYERIRRRQRELSAQRETRLQALQLEPELITVRAVLFLAHALVMPSTDPEDRKMYDMSAENVAMRNARAHEEAAGAKVVDIHTPPLARAAGLTDHPGFDLLSYRPDDEIRQIEVKGRASSYGKVELSENEWAAAYNGQDNYWLYAVYNCATPSPKLLRVQNPFKKQLGAPKGGWMIDKKEIEAAAET